MCEEWLDFGYAEGKEDFKGRSNSMKKVQDWEFPGVSRKPVSTVLCFGWNILCGWRSHFGRWENSKCLGKGTLRD